MGVDIKSIVGMVAKHKIATVGILAGAAVFAGSATFIIAKENPQPIVEVVENEIMTFASKWPSSFTSDAYSEPEFIDDENRTNNAFNVADFGEQGTNGWFYRYGSSQDPARSLWIRRGPGNCR